LTLGRLTRFAIPQSATFNLLKEEGSTAKKLKPVTHLKSKYGITMCTEELHLPHR